MTFRAQCQRFTLNIEAIRDIAAAIVGMLILIFMANDRENSSLSGWNGSPLQITPYSRPQRLDLRGRE